MYIELQELASALTVVSHHVTNHVHRAYRSKQGARAYSSVQVRTARTRATETKSSEQRSWFVCNAASDVRRIRQGFACVAQRGVRLRHGWRGESQELGARGHCQCTRAVGDRLNRVEAIAYVTSVCWCQQLRRTSKRQLRGADTSNSLECCDRRLGVA